MFLPTNVSHMKSSSGFQAMPTVFRTKPDAAQPLETVKPRFTDYGSSSETDTDDDDCPNEDEDTIVRWGWVWYKGEMRRTSEIDSECCNPGVGSRVSQSVSSSKILD